MEGLIQKIKAKAGLLRAILIGIIMLVLFALAIKALGFDLFSLIMP